ncbi:type I secretion system permease/ATPase [Aquifex aeolicus]|uniref:ABC transporter (HlyB subfamily) n=2 Tax=Aquifex aeolicus (strain VF5) TaxID=224324 RepID=O67184_AQUAE|nr:type I secretion system permease/ATPase [Aquifex aeolicus]AAC07149.1 ABC transporter (hlyB subfamily) [Aquifex aeolicus VF5]
MATKENTENVLRSYLAKYKKTLIIVGLFSLFINILFLLPSIYMLAVYDIVVPSTSVPTLLVITALAVVLYFALGLLQSVRAKVMQIISLKLDSELNKEVFTSSFEYAIRNPSKASAQPINDLYQLKQFLTSPVLFAIFDLPWVPIYFGVLFVFHVYYGVMAILSMAVIVALAILNEYITKKKLKESNELLVRSTNFLNRALLNAEVVEALGMRNNLYKKWMNFYSKHLSAFEEATDRNNFLSNLTRIFRIMAQSLMLGLGGYLAIKHEITTGMIVAGSILLGRILGPIDTIVNGWRQIGNTKVAYTRLNEFLKFLRFKREVSVKLPEPKGEIELSNVVVVPPEGKTPVLRNINMRILPGEFVAIIGPSGSGKSSLVRTILGIWLPVHGTVEIDGADLKQWDRDYFGKFVGYLPQDIELFEGTVAENIARFGELDSEKIIEAAKLSGAHDVIIKLPDGYDTYIGPGGITLSGGQRQRIALARALYGNPRIVILDEPDSNLDEQGEQALYNALIELKKRKVTTIIVSHRIRLLNLVDKIAIMQDGTLKAFGKADIIIQKLLRKNVN